MGIYERFNDVEAGEGGWGADVCGCGRARTQLSAGMTRSSARSGSVDALTGIVWRNDSQAVRPEPAKDYGAPGVIVWVERVTQESPELAGEDGSVPFA